MPFTENFNYCMNKRGYSAYRFSKLIGANNQSVLNWQHGATVPHYNTRIKIAEHFGIALAELDGDELPVLPEKNTAVPQNDEKGKENTPIGESDGRDAVLMELMGKLTAAEKEIVIAQLTGLVQGR